MTISFENLHELGFTPSHEIILNHEGKPRFSELKSAPKATVPAVYIWLSHATEANVGEVLYVGKAGKGVSRRCGQHQGGFASGKGAGAKNATALSEVLRLGTCVTVMARTSNTTELFGKTVSMYATEEDALHSLFGPRLNRAGFPDVSGQAVLAAAPSLGNAIDLSEDRLPKVQSRQTAVNVEQTRIGMLIDNRLSVQEIGTVDDMLAQIESYAPQELTRFERLLSFIDDFLLKPDHSLKLIGGYTDQPKGCNGVTTLGFGRLVNRNFASNGWIARVYLTDPVRVSFPRDLLKPGAYELVEQNDKFFSPLDVDEFLNSPETFIEIGNRT